MTGSVQIRWFSALLLLATLPAAPQSLLSSTENNSTTEDISATNEAGDIPEITRAPESPQAPQLTPEELGDIYLVRQRYMAAIREYQKIEHPSAAVWNKLGIAFQQMSGLKESERSYKESLKQDPKNAKVLNNLATVQDQMGKFEAAEKNYRKAMSLNPNSAIFHKNLGTNLLMQHEYEKGHAAYKEALRLDPRIFDDHFGPKVNDPAPEEERGTASYFKARSCARAGLTDCAINFLIKAFNEGSATVEKVNEEADFSILQGTPALARLIARQQ